MPDQDQEYQLLLHLTVAIIMIDGGNISGPSNRSADHGCGHLQDGPRLGNVQLGHHRGLHLPAQLGAGDWLHDAGPASPHRPLRRHHPELSVLSPRTGGYAGETGDVVSTFLPQTESLHLLQTLSLS